MKNITLSLDEEVLASVRKVAANRETSVNAMVREYLSEVASQDCRIEDARQEILRLSKQTEGKRGKARWSREDLHES